MMKDLLSVFTLTLLAAPSFAAPVPAEQLQSYKDVVNLALRTQGIDDRRCISKGPYSIYVGQTGYFDDNHVEALVNQMSKLDVSGGDQPLLKFSRISQNYIYNIYVTTSADFSRIVSLHVVESISKAVQVEKGNLKNPDMETETTWEVTGIADCK